MNVKLNQVYGELNRPDGRPERRLKLVRLYDDRAVLQVIGRLDKAPVACSCKSSNGHRDGCPLWGLGMGIKTHVSLQQLGVEGHYPLLEDAP